MKRHNGHAVKLQPARNAPARPGGKRTSRPAKTESDISAERVKIHLRSRFNPIRNLDPAKLVRQIENFRAGFLREFAITAHIMEEQDDTLATVAPKTKRAVARYGFEVLNLDFDENNAELTKLAADQKATLERFYNNISVTSALEQDERGSFQLLVRQMVDAHGMKYSVHEIVWKRKRDSIAGVEFYTAEFVHCPLQFFEATIGKLRFIEQELGIEGVDMEEGAWLVSVGQGVMIACAIAYMFKHLPLKDWLGFCEKFGFPGVHGKTNAPKGSAEWNAMKSAVANFMLDWGVVTTADEAIELIEAKASGNTLPFDPLVDRMDRALTRLWRGADLGTMSRDKQTTGVTAQTDETEIIEEDLAAWATETLNIKLDRLVLEYTYGPDVPVLAFVQVKVKQRLDVDKEIKIDNHLVGHGARLSLRDAMERYGRVEAGADEEILTPAMQEDAASGASPDKSVKKKKAANQRRRDATRLIETAAQQLGEARLADFHPLLARIAVIANVTNEAAFKTAANNLRLRLPEYLRALNAKPAEAEVLAETMTASFFNAMDDAARDREVKRVIELVDKTEEALAA